MIGDIIIGIILSGGVFYFFLRAPLMELTKSYDIILSQLHSKAIKTWHRPEDHKWYTNFNKINPPYPVLWMFGFYLFMMVALTISIFTVMGVLGAISTDIKMRLYSVADYIPLLSFIIVTIGLRFYIHKNQKIVNEGRHILSTY